ncbi:FMRFamide receptor-like [Tubulanus polymorphus]|uniref:FMRFamide receptor-like n=1 Tax=Tubulanus polymorphus TaxID=672921 RepID=UPI003DA5AAC2
MVCAFGIIGNLLNLIVLTRKRFTKSMETMERTAQLCLTALAGSDLIICSMTFPGAVLPQKWLYEERSFGLYFSVYSGGLINAFVLFSTWLTVVMTIERYIVVCHPLHARSIVGIKRTVRAVVIVLVLSIGVNLPRFWMTEIIDVKCDKFSEAPSNTNQTCYITKPSSLEKNVKFIYAYRGVYFVLGFCIPLITLIFCNCNLIRALTRSSQLQRRHSAQVSYRTNRSKDRLTVTLIAIITLFCVLVSPSEIRGFISSMADIRKDYSRYQSIITAGYVTNFALMINFSMNFVLYCAVNYTFRKTMKSMLFSCIYGTEKSNGTRHQNGSVRDRSTNYDHLTMSVSTPIVDDC